MDIRQCTHIQHKDIRCLGFVLSKLIGYTIVAGSTVVKLPQLYNIYNAKTVTGISLLSLLCALIGITISLSFNLVKHYPFSTWGESITLSFQYDIIIMFYFYYTKRLFHLLFFLLAYIAFLMYLTMGYISQDTLTMLAVASIPTGQLSKVIQILVNFYHGHTGVLSKLTIGLEWLGSMGRIYTTLLETDSFVLLANFVIDAACNTVLFLQIIFYRKLTRQVLLVQHNKEMNDYI